MNKKITAVTLTALMVLTMFSAMVPTALGAKEVAAPYEFIGAVNDTKILSYSNLSATSRNNPSILYYDIDDAEGDEKFDMVVWDNTSINDGELIYSTTQWTDDEGYDYISWTGSKYAIIQNGTGDWIISEKLVDEDDNDDHLLRVGESLALAGGYSLSALEIDVDGGEAWISLTKDGEEIDNEVVIEKNYFVFEEDLGASDDTEVMNFTVETVFAGMNTNLVKVSNIDLISMDTLKIESSDTDLYDDFKITTKAKTIEIKNDDEISFGEDSLTEIMGDNFAIRVNEESTLVALVKIITEPGTYELIGAVNDTQILSYSNLSATSRNNPSILYYDIDDAEGNEKFDMVVWDNTSINDGELIYSTTQWTDDEGYDYISWTGSKYAIIQNGTGDWIISEKLVDEDDNDDHLLRVGESLALAGGYSLSALEIDVDGGEAWISLTKDGEEIDNEVVIEKNYFVFEEDLGASDDTEVMNFTVETVFAGMNTNLVKVSNIDLISMDTLKIESSDTDLYDDFKVNTKAKSIEIKNDDEISFGEDALTEIMGDNFAIRVNEDSTLVALVQEVIVGGGAAATVAPTVAPDVNATVEPDVNATVVGTAAPPTAEPDETAAAPTPTPTKEPGFEAVFAIAGLLAVAYLVLRQRE